MTPDRRHEPESELASIWPRRLRRGRPRPAARAQAIRTAAFRSPSRFERDLQFKFSLRRPGPGPGPAAPALWLRVTRNSY